MNKREQSPPLTRVNDYPLEQVMNVARMLYPLAPFKPELWSHSARWDALRVWHTFFSTTCKLLASVSQRFGAIVLQSSDA